MTTWVPTTQEPPEGVQVLAAVVGELTEIVNSALLTSLTNANRTLPSPVQLRGSFSTAAIVVAALSAVNPVLVSTRTAYRLIAPTLPVGSMFTAAVENFPEDAIVVDFVVAVGVEVGVGVGVGVGVAVAVADGVGVRDDVVAVLGLPARYTGVTIDWAHTAVAETTTRPRATVSSTDGRSKRRMLKAIDVALSRHPCQLCCTRSA